MSFGSYEFGIGGVVWTCLWPFDGFAGPVESANGLDGECGAHVHVSILGSRQER